MKEQTKEIIISVWHGVVDVHSLPKGVKVKVVDFDTEGVQKEHIEKFENRDAVISEYDVG